MKNSTKKITAQLKDAVNKTEDVTGNFKNGIGAVKSSDKAKISVPDSRKLTGSLNIDDSTKILYPNESRWDYAIEYNGETFFIEIHPGETSEVAVVINKLNWLKKWLKEKAPSIDAIKATSKPPFYWIFTSRFNILPTSKYYKQLSIAGLKPVRIWDFNKI